MVRATEPLTGRADRAGLAGLSVSLLKGAPAQLAKKIIAAARAAGGSLQHLTLNFMRSLQRLQVFSGAACALSRAADINQKQGNGERCAHETCRPPRPIPGQDRVDQTTPYQRSPFFQSSTRDEMRAMPA